VQQKVAALQEDEPYRWLPARRAIVATATATATAATAAVTTTTTAAAATVATIAAAASTATAAASTAVLSGPGFVDVQVTAVKFLAVELLNGRFAFFLGGHFHKTEATRTTCFAILDNAG
jgi:hypothetical protein